MPRDFVRAGTRQGSGVKEAKSLRSRNETALGDKIFALPMASKSRVESLRLTVLAIIRPSC